ncbi:MAG: hypothetical protein R2856_18600 [Caldilineaceae bacterium]
MITCVCCNRSSKGGAAVVYGSRFLGGPRFGHEPEPHRGQQRRHLDHKSALRHDPQRHGNLLQVFPPRRDHSGCRCSRRFEIEPELTAKILKRGHSIFEVPISYNGREFHEGKKLTWRDGFAALMTLLRYRFSD